jgi:hypothetical protein
VAPEEKLVTDLATARSPVLIEPGNPEYDVARRPWLVNVKLRPAAVALPGDADDIAALVQHAARTGNRLALQSTGHHAHTLGGLEFAVVAVGAAPEPASTARTIAALSGVTTALSPWRSGADYLNFSAPPARPQRFFDPTTVTRLSEVARSYDPDGLFQPDLPVAG